MNSDSYLLNPLDQDADTSENRFATEKRLSQAATSDVRRARPTESATLSRQ